MRISVFIDCENIIANHSQQIFSFLRETGKVVLCQGYADFANPFYRGWQEPLITAGSRSIHVFHNTKDSADREILIDSTECAIKERKIDAICIVSNDGIYSSPKRVFHKYEKRFLVIGTNVANRALEDAADTFMLLEGTDPRSSTPEEVIDEMISNNGGMMRLSDLGNAVWGLLPNYKVMGFRNMMEYIASLGFPIEQDTTYDPPIAWVRNLPK